jgi:Small Multidrug Resistance protein
VRQHKTTALAKFQRCLSATLSSSELQRKQSAKTRALALAIVAEVAGTVALKASVEFIKLVPSIIVVVCYAIAFFFLALTFRTIPV